MVHPAELSVADIAAWRRLQEQTPQFGSPLLGARFARTVGDVRIDARVAIYRRGGRIVGFLAHHRRPRGFARPIGAPFCDYHGLVAAPDAGLAGAEALQAAGLSAMRLTGLVDPFGAFASARPGSRAYRVLAERSAASPPAASVAAATLASKHHRRYRRSLEQAIGQVQLVADDRDGAAFERLIAWKRAHLARTGLHDFLAAPWSAELMRRLFETRSAGFGGLMISLYAGDRLAAAHFGVRQGGWFHPWIGAFDPQLKAHSPGSVHQVEALGAMGELALHTYDLGPGEDHWKRRLATDSVQLGQGLAAAPTIAGGLAARTERFWDAAALRGAPLAGRARGRLDQIAALELTLAGRARGIARALITHRRREWAA